MKHEQITQLRQRAEALAHARPTAKQALDLVGELKAANEFGTARRLLQRLRALLPKEAKDGVAAQDAVALGQAHALCTYKGG